MMGSIFSQASRVFACVGPHTASSRRLEHEVLEGPITDTFDSSLIIGSQAWSDRLVSLDPEYIRELAIIVKVFVVGLTYLERLWVAQELYEARGRAWVLCGSSSIYWTTWQKLVFFAGPYFDLTGTPHPKEATLPAHFLAMANLVSSRDEVRFPEILADAGLLKCEDPRDCIYGLQRLIDWNADGIIPIMPDYRLSREELAVKAILCATRRTEDNARTIIEALQVAMDINTLLAHAQAVKGRQDSILGQHC